MANNNTLYKKNKIANTFIFVVLTSIGILFLLPFLWMIVVSFERYANIQPPFPPSFVIKDPSLFNFKVITENGDMFIAYKNSFIIAVFSVAINLFAVLTGGYAWSKGNFRGKNIIFMIVLSTMMIPFETRLIPMYEMFNSLNMTNTFLPLILPEVIDGFGLLMAKQFFDKLPDTLGEAAEIDGASPFGTFFQIFLPLTSPIVATITILKFMGSWNSFLWPLVILTGVDKRTVPVFISSFSGVDGARLAGSTMCVAFLGIIPVLLVFLLMQKYIIASVALSGVKGE